MADRGASAQGAGPIAPEIAFLSGFGVAQSILIEATEIAERTAVSADLALLASGAVAEGTFYRALARRLDVPYLERDIRIAPRASAAMTIAAGVAPTAPGAGDIRFILAPQGVKVVSLLADRRDRRVGASFAITPPRCFAAAVRQALAAVVANAAVRDLVVDGKTQSARYGPSLAQTAALASFNGIAVFCCVALPVAACFVMSIPLLLAILARLAAIAVSRPLQRAAATRRILDCDLPVYTILVPLYREARVAAKLVRSLDRLDYPHSRLDIKLLTEEADSETRNALVGLDLPTRYEILVAPNGYPRTKPRALNIGLATARGSLLVVYDAEDEPDPDQLRAAARRFAAAHANLGCLQARLAIHNMGDGWLARLFAIDYGALFDAVNPGQAALRLPMLLGGTSNHFRTAVLHEVGGWDAWNVTEDADLGIRLARRGYDVEMLDSSTFEEAPDKVGAWLKQRSRWYKGWMQTLGVHTRDIAATVGELGLVRGVICLISLASGLLSGLFGPVLTAVTVYHLCNGDLLHPNSRFEAAVAALACLVLALGAMCMVWPVVLGILRRRRSALLSTVALLPVYYVLLMLASWMALLDLAWKPHRWVKTEHGLGRHARAKAATSA